MSHPPETISRDLIRQCVQCGMCLSACPTFRLTGSELDSPRGRIFQMDLVRRGEVSPADPEFQQHIDFCLGCRACETACPSGVQYGTLIEQARAVRGPKDNAAAGMVRRAAAHPLLLRLFGLTVRLYQKLGLQRLARATGIASHLPGSLRAAEASLAPVEGGLVSRRLPRLKPARNPARYRVAFLEGCLMAEFLPQTNHDTIDVLAINGIEVVVPAEQGCCGALHLHSGDADIARRLARQNVKAFGPLDVDAIVTNSAGCGSTLKEYGRVLGEPEEGVFRVPVRDVHEFLTEVGLTAAPPPHPITVTYQDACHLAHAQRVREQPRQLLEMIPGLKLVEMANADWCCGSAGTYNLEHPQAAGQLLGEKVAAIAATGAEVVAAANPGCLMQLNAGLARAGLPITARHPLAILADAYRRQPVSTLAPGNKFSN